MDIGFPKGQQWAVVWKREGEAVTQVFDHWRGFGLEPSPELALEKVIHKLRQDPQFRQRWGNGFFVPIAVHLAVHVLPHDIREPG